MDIKADRDLFRRVIVALESKRDIDVDLLLQRESSPVPVSLPNVNGKLTSPSNRALLSHLLQENVAQSYAPLNHSETCTIIDGMGSVHEWGTELEQRHSGSAVTYI